MRIQDRISFTHSALHVEGFCGNRKRSWWWLQYPGDLKTGAIFNFIQRK